MNVHDWAHQGNLENIKKAVSENVEAAVLTDEHGSTPLHYAAMGNQPSIVRYLVSTGADINCTDNYGSTPLHSAAYGNSIECMEELAKLGANPLQLTTHGRSIQDNAKGEAKEVASRLMQIARGDTAVGDARVIENSNGAEVQQAKHRSVESGSKKLRPKANLPPLHLPRNNPAVSSGDIHFEGVVQVGEETHERRATTDTAAPASSCSSSTSATSRVRLELVLLGAALLGNVALIGYLLSRK